MERRRRIRRWERGERLCGGRLNGGEQKNRFQNKYRRAEDFLREPGPGDFAPMVHGRLTGAGQKLQEQPANVKPDPPSCARGVSAHKSSADFLIRAFGERRAQPNWSLALRVIEQE